MESRSLYHREWMRGQRMVTVRMPQELHDGLKAEAARTGWSINQLCIAAIRERFGEATQHSEAEAADG